MKEKKEETEKKEQGDSRQLSHDAEGTADRPDSAGNADQRESAEEAEGKEKPKPKPERLSFDTIIKAGLEPYYPDLLQWLLGERPSEVTPLDPNLPVARRREADKLLKVEFKDRPSILAHLEFQTESDLEMPARMAEYITLIHRLRKDLSCEEQKFVCAVIYLDPETFHGDPGSLVIEGEFGTWFGLAYKVVKLWELDPAKVLESGSPGLCALVPLMAGKPEELLVKSIQRIMETPGSLLGPKAKEALIAVAVVLASRRVENKNMLSDIAEQFSLETDNYFINWVRQNAREAGKAEGKAEGRVEGALEKAREAVLRVLEARFGALSEAVSQRILAMNDPAELDRLLDLAVVAPDLPAFLDGLR